MKMTQITQGSYKMPAATLYADNRLPDIFNNGALGVGANVRGDGLSEKHDESLQRGYVKTILPYTLQDHYDRTKEPREFVSVTMENDYLRAVILPEIGGRVWSLYDKRHGRELLFVNPVYQPANFALRNAWVAGGIEFNIGVRGHCVFTSSTIFCDINRYADGRQTVKLYEYERIRGVVYSVELMLPDDSDSLFARVTIENTSRDDKYMYWWTNVAITEAPDIRVLTPADNYLRTDYEAGEHLIRYRSLSETSVGMDATRPTRNARSRDFFYDLPDTEGRWIVSADRDGYGLAFTSTDMLIGRKLFVWGMGNGGRNWCAFLAEENLAYAEIQGGLSRHQFEHIPMPADTTWQWVEAYTPFEGDAALLHSDVLPVAREEVGRNLRMPGYVLEEADPFHGIGLEALKERTTVTCGSGWGHVEDILRARRGERGISKECVFTLSTSAGQQNEWLYLIENGSFPSEDVKEPPKGFMTGGDIIDMLTKAAANKKGAYTYLQLGTALFIGRRYKEAEAAWQESMDIEPNAWAARNIAMLKRYYNDYDGACSYILRAVGLNAAYRPLMVDCANILTEAERYGEWVDIYDGLPLEIKQLGRIKALTAKAYIELDRIEEAEGLINEDLVIEDLLEGELMLERLWAALYAKRGEMAPPLPKKLDFSMTQC